MEGQILASIAASREAYETVAPFVKDSDLSERGFRIYQELDRYYQKDEAATSADWGIVLKRIERSLPSKKLMEQFYITVEQMAGLELSPANIAAEYLDLRKDAVGQRLARALNQADFSEITELYDEYGELLEATVLGEAQEVAIDIQELFEERLSDAAKTRILPGALNHLIGGGVRPGDTIVVIGRPNAGKSLYTINAATGFVQQGLRVLYIENEDSKERTLSRFVRRLVQKDKDYCIQHAAEIRDVARARNRDLFHMYKLTPGTSTEIEALVRRVQPDVLIVNQIRGIARSLPGKMTGNMERVAVSLRNIGQKYDLITIMVTQANAPPKDKYGQVQERAVMYMEDTDSSLTGIPGACDFIFGVGTTRELKRHETACITVAKSKDEGDGEHIYVGVLPEIDKIISQPKG